jgi:hypothetical protein
MLAATGIVTILISLDQQPRTFDPVHAFGAAIDGHEKGDVDRMLSPANVRAMLSAGLHPVSYRLRTELAGEAWHWNPRGTWSDPDKRQGYWTSSDVPADPIELSYGYRLPRRGNTLDQANNDGYSRLDDGDPSTFWKSNPYLDRSFTGEDNARHPQWVVADLGKRRPVNTIRIAWGEPYATDYAVEYAPGSLDPERFTDPDVWHAFPNGSLHASGGGERRMRLADRTIRTRLIRVLLKSSAAHAVAVRDPRDRLGFAIREIYIGEEAGGRFRDWIAHGADRDNQSVMYVSSTDPWHRETDRDDRTEQPGLDRIYRDGLTQGLPALIPAGVLYDTPENAAAEVRYLGARNYRVEGIELGEEPEEQYGAPEDYAALYLGWASALHRIDPLLRLGGPSLVADAGELDNPVTAFIGRFWKYLAERGRQQDFAFFTFEWYPFDNICAPIAPQLALAHRLLDTTMREFRRAGLPPSLPRIITEYGYSPYGAEAEVDLPGALLNAEVAAEFVALGGDQSFLYGYEPNNLIQQRPCTWGNLMLFGLDDDAGIRYRTAAYYAARLITQEWVLPSGGAHQLYRATSEIPGISAYAVHRPDDRWAILLLNRDPSKEYDVLLRLTGAAHWTANLSVYQFSKKQYRWHSAGRDGHPKRSDPPVRFSVNADAPVHLPPYSITVVQSPPHTPAE